VANETCADLGGILRHEADSSHTLPEAVSKRRETEKEWEIEKRRNWQTA